MNKSSKIYIILELLAGLMTISVILKIRGMFILLKNALV